MQHASERQEDQQRRREIFARVRRIEIATRKTVNDVMAGAYHSVFKGQGMEFDTVRRYEPGDDIRSIDWNVSARMNETYIKVFHEERELTIMLLVDLSASQGFGTRARAKAELAAELAALLAFAAIKNNDKVGVLLFTDRVEQFIRPDRGRKHVLRVISEILSFEPEGRGTDIARALQFLSGLKVRRSVAFLLSDFQAQGYERDLRLAARKHDMVAFCLEDPLEKRLPPMGLVRMTDPEAGVDRVVDLSDRRVRAHLENLHRAEREERDRLLKLLHIDSLAVSTDVEDKPYTLPLVQFFKRRAERR